MNKVTVEQIRKIQRFSGIARICCALFAAVLLALLCAVGYGLFAGSIEDNDRISIGTFVLQGEQMQGGGIRAWLLIALSTASAIGLGMIYLLYGVFTDLQRGEIFNAANVRRIHLIGMLILWIGVWQFVVPYVSTIVLSEPTHRIRHYSFWVTPFAVGALIILVSWIMNVGLGVSEEAAELKRDADLVV